MRCILMIAALPLAAASTLAIASPGESAAPAQITAVARSTQHHGWLQLRQAESGGAFEARVSFADLDLAGPAGLNAARARIDHAAADVCQMLGSDPEMPGVSAVDQRSCYRGVHADLSGRLESVVAEARSREGTLARR